MRLFVLLLLLIFSAGIAMAAASVVPAVINPGFEEKESGWGWTVTNGFRGWYRPEAENPHSGKLCMAFVSQSGFAPNVYGRFNQYVPVLPDTLYELTVWVRGEEVAGQPGSSHFTDWWTYTLNLPNGTFGWQRVSTRFKTHPGQDSLNLGLNMVNSCKELALDDLCLTPVAPEVKEGGIAVHLQIPSRVVGHNAPSSVRVGVSPSRKEPVYVELTIRSGKKQILNERSRMKPEDNFVEWKWNTGSIPYGKISATVRVSDLRGKKLAETTQTTEIVDSPLFRELDRAQARFKGEFMELYRRCEERGLALDYPRTARTTLEQFLPLAYTDVQKDLNGRAELAAKDFHRILDEAIAMMKACLANPRLVPIVRRYQTGKVAVDGLSFIGDRSDTNGKRDRGPVFFCGYGHFAQVRTDMSRWPGYGVNIIQSAEFGPSAVFPSENEVSLDYPKKIAKAFDDAARHNVKVDLLLSPHYFPNWAFEKWPHLAKGGGGFLGFMVDEAEAKQVIEKFLRIVVPLFKDKPALHSFCLSNEPVLISTADADNTRPLWAACLARVHGDLKTMNERYGSNYAKFEEVPIPGGDACDAPQFYDYCVFNNERFAGWHKWMADIIHEMAPDVPVHAKVMSNWLNRGTTSWGCDPELFAEMGQLNGNDCCFFGDPGADYCVPWFAQTISYDIQRSCANKPIFNSENHLTIDGSTEYVPPEHFRTALWLGTMHGQSATTIWVWERTFDPGYTCFYGDVMDRPGCALAVGTTCLDLNRFADEIAAIQRGKSPAAILYSIASMVRDPGYVSAACLMYTSLSFLGFRPDFITEKQLAAGKGADYRMIVFPEAGHVLPASFEATRKLPESVRLVMVGTCLVKDPWGRKFPAEQVQAIRDRALIIPADPDAGKQWPVMRQELQKLNALPEVSVADAITGEPVRGLEWLPARIGNRYVISIVNLRTENAMVEILVNGRRVAARDLLSLGGLDNVRVIKPAKPVLAEVIENTL